MKNLELRLEIKETLPKTNDSPSDCQDILSVNLGMGRFAVADGVTRSFFPAEWSRLLVEQFCHDTSKFNLELFKTQNWQDWLPPIQNKWSALIHDKVSKKTGVDSIHLKNSLIARDPAASTFVGLQVDTYASKPTWQAMIIGDSCLFYFKNKEFTPYLMKNSSNFNYHPQYFSSIPSSRKDTPSFLNGSLEIGDVFVLTTDALAKWLFIQRERNSSNWDKTLQTLFSIKNRQELFTFVSNARINKEFTMEDDDVALIILSCVRAAESHKKTPPETPVFVKESQQPIIAVAPHQTSIKSTKGEMIQNRKDDSTYSKKSSSSKSALPILAILISFISLMVSFYILFLFRDYQRNGVITPTSTSLPPTPTQFYAVKGMLPANTPIYLYQDIRSQILLTTQNNTSVMVLEQGGGWYKVEVELWVFVNPNEPIGFSLQDNLITTKSAIPAYSAVSNSPIMLGVFSPNVNLQKINEFSDISGIWYQVRFQGYVLGR